MKSLHVVIDKENHPFLEYDSYINCSEIRIFNRQEVIDFLINNPYRAVGNVSETVLRKVHQLLSTATTIPRILKNKFGF